MLVVAFVDSSGVVDVVVDDLLPHSGSEHVGIVIDPSELFIFKSIAW